jgi:hypothetical protein
MRALLPVCAGIAVVTGFVSVNLWRQLHAERQVNEELRTQLATARAVRPVVAAPSPTIAANVTATPAPTPTPEVPACKPEPAPKPAATTTVATSLQESLNRQNELMKDPEYRKLRLAQTRASIERNYPGLAEELGLSEKEADKLFDLLAENQVAMSAEVQLLSVNTEDQAAMAEMSRRRTELQREQEASLRNLLGGKYAQYQSYQQTMPARSRVTSIGLQLAQIGMPLNETQTRALTAAVIADQQRQRQDAQLAVRPAGNPTDPEYRAKMMEDALKRTEENNRRLVEAAAPHLNAKQLAAFREQMEQQTAMNRISQRMQIERERLQNQQQQPQPR